MKKFLSLVLALVMTMSLVTVSAGAKDFDDAADITYVEAVDVMSEIGIVDGDTAGNFNPTNGLTRGAAAKIICNLILGPTTAAELNADTDPYPDVDKDSTFAGYIAYCQKEGIVGGYADGTFKPANPLTGYAFMKMLLGALGYDAAVEGYTGANWSINVAKQAIGIGLNDNLVGNFNGSDFVTREEAMLYAFNTLKATMVDYDTTITIGDVTVAGSNEYDVENNARVETIAEDGKMQFAEKYFTKLSVKDDIDAFDRPCNTWVNGKETIGTYVDYTEIVAEYTTTVTGKELYDVVGKTAYNDYDFTAYVDGVEDTDLCDKIAKNNKGDVAETGNGALTQVFVDNDNEEVIITVVNTYLAQATADYNAKKDSVSFEIFNVSTETVSGEDFDIADIVDDQFVLVTYSADEDSIESIADVEIVADTAIDKYTAGKGGSVTVDGEKYSYNQTAYYDAAVLDLYTGIDTDVNLKDTTYNIYLDQYGYVVGIDEVDPVTNYLFVTGADSNSSNLANKTWDANAIFLDGTSAVIEVKNNGAISNVPVINKWYSYTVSNSGVYTLTLVNDSVAITDGTTSYDVAQKQSGSSTVAEIDAKHISLTGVGADARVYGNDDSVYLLAELDKVSTSTQDYTVITGVDEIVTGVKNTAYTTYNWSEARTAAEATKGTVDATTTSSGVYALYKENGYIIAAVVVGESDTVSSDLAYVLDGGVSSESYDKTDKTWTWTHDDVIVDGVEVELKEVNDTGVSVLKDSTVMFDGNWVTVKYDADGNVKKVVDYGTAPGDVIVNTVALAVAQIVADEELVVLDTTASTVYELKGSTLYDATNDQLGFLVAEDVKVVLNQTVKGKNTTSYDEGIKVLESTLDNLNADGNNYAFDAIIEDGVATVVIIIDNGADETIVGPAGSTSTSDAYGVASVDKALRTIYLNKEENVGAFDEDKAVKAAQIVLSEMGWEITSTTLDKTTTPWSVTAVNMNSANNTVLNWAIDWEK